MDLFAHREAKLTQQNAPLAARMRPRTIEEYVGQDHIMAPGRLLRRAIEADRLSSLIFYGPPGTGKTTLAEVIARRTEAHFEAINAVLAGVKDLREAIAGARSRLGQMGQRTVLFIDEVHRFNKAQQDALLPWVERGTVILIGATTENPYFEVNKALVSRSRVFQLETLEPHHLRAILHRALQDPERGYGNLDVFVEEDACEHLVNIANGDARSLLGALELAVETTVPDEHGVIRIDLEVAEESIQRRAVLYDKEGDAHFDIISAYIKSMRGSDPDAALYWLARMVYAGEDPRFIFRRLIIFASEDVGLAAPEAITITESLAAAYDRVGMPEGRYHLSQATLYLATAPKSNSTMGFFDALASVAGEKEGEVPVHLKDGTRDKEGFGHGKGYLYPHAYRDHWVAQQYLPSGLQGRLFYTPSTQGHEAGIHDQVMRRRDAQLAAMIERDAAGISPFIEVLTNSPEDRALEQWMARTVGDAGERLGEQRDRLFALAAPARHHLVLDLRARTGLLLWEALRQVPEGGVWARCEDEQRALDLGKRAERLPDLRRPVLFASALDALANRLDEVAPEILFDRIVGQNALVGYGEIEDLLVALAAKMRAGGKLVLIEALPSRAQRLVALRQDWGLPGDLVARWREAEEEIYRDVTDPMLAMNEDAWRAALAHAGLEPRADLLEQIGKRHVPESQIERWWTSSDTSGGERASYRDRLAASLSEDELQAIEAAMRERLSGEVVSWSNTSVLLCGEKG